MLSGQRLKGLNKMDTAKLAELLFPDISQTVDNLESLYPPRKLKEGAKVTRIAPSPTGFIHLGNLYGALIDERLAHQSDGIFYLRVEDTDAKREVAGAVELAIHSLHAYGLHFDEGIHQGGNYGPYQQRLRADIYKIVAKKLVLEGKAYPCFCTEDELTSIHDQQEAESLLPGYYGKWAKHRDMPLEQIEQELLAKKPYIIRLRSPGNPEGKVHHTDLIRGEMELPENFNDIILLKSDGIPTYHFAHVVDDHFMRTTHVVRGEEWLSTLPWHLQMFDILGWKRPKYIHTAHLLKSENGGKRKLSKRKDPELGLQYYDENGFPKDAVIEYLMTLLNSNYEDWHRANPEKDYKQFPFTIKKMSPSGALFDMDKLCDITKNVVAAMDATTVFKNVVDWAQKYDIPFYNLLTADPEYAIKILSIGRGGTKPRKDLCLWRDVKTYMDFFYDDLFTPDFTLPANVTNKDAIQIVTLYRDIYDAADDQQTWFEKVKMIAQQVGYAPETKQYKKDPALYKGHVGDVAMVLRIAVSGKQQSPDTYEVMKILGKDRVLLRLERAKGEWH